VVVKPPQRVLDQALELVGGATESLVEAGRVLRHRQRLVVRQARFHHAALVAASGLVVVLVAQVHLDARHVVDETAQVLLDLGVGPALQRVLVGDAVARIDLYLHAISSLDG